MTQLASLPLCLMTKQQRAVCLHSKGRGCKPIWYDNYCIINDSHWEWPKGTLASSEILGQKQRQALGATQLKVKCFLFRHRHAVSCRLGKNSLHNSNLGWVNSSSKEFTLQVDVTHSELASITAAAREQSSSLQESEPVHGLFFFPMFGWHAVGWRSH